MISSHIHDIDTHVIVDPPPLVQTLKKVHRRWTFLVVIKLQKFKTISVVIKLPLYILLIKNKWYQVIYMILIHMWSSTPPPLVQTLKKVHRRWTILVVIKLQKFKTISVVIKLPLYILLIKNKWYQVIHMILIHMWSSTPPPPLVQTLKKVPSMDHLCSCDKSARTLKR